MSRVFVVQGFGAKTDLTDGRVLNLDASYEVIKEAVEEAGHECVRADEIIHTGTIDIPMYEQLLRADVVIADLSTYNVNAAFELGVRYGLRPRATIVVAEELFKSPFDVNHIVIRRYKHLGEDIGMREAKRFKEDLVTVIRTILEEDRIDSPVYSLLHGLLPPQLEAAMAAVAAAAPAAPTTGDLLNMEAPDAPAPRGMAAPGPAAAVADARLTELAGVLAEAAPSAPQAAGDAQESAHAWKKKAHAAMKAEDFAAARAAWEELRKFNPNDSHVIQQLALATYKSKQPSVEEALLAARAILAALAPATTNDPETLGLWGAIHKRLWDLHKRAGDLSESIAAYERGFLLKQDYYNGINLAFLLDLRALEAARAGERDEAIADSVQARRVRREVVRYALPLLKPAEEQASPEHRFWIVATLWEAALGVGDGAETARWEAAAQALPVANWMRETQHAQGERLKQIQAELAELLGK